MQLSAGDDTAILLLFFGLFFGLFIFLVVLLRAGVKIVRHAEVMILERFGRYKTTLKPGIHFLWPFIEKPRRIYWKYLDMKPGAADASSISSHRDTVDLREHVIDFGKQHVITKDTVQIHIDALVYYQITDPTYAVYKVQNLPDALELLVQTTLRNVIAQITLDDTFSSRELINSQLKNLTFSDAERWGVTITRVEVMNIFPPVDIKRAMEEQIREERERRSTVLTADGERESGVVRSKGDAATMILRAEGYKTAQLLQAKGEVQAKLMLAGAEAASINAIREPLAGSSVRATDYLLAVQYLNSIKKMTAAGGHSKVVMLPRATVDGLAALSPPTKEKIA